MAQFMRPSIDTSNAGWTRENGSSTNLFDSINDVTQTDTDYIQSGLNPSNQVYVFKLSPIVDPGVDTGHIVRIAGGKSLEGGRKIDLLFELREAYVNESNQGTLRGSATFLDIPAAVAPFPLFQSPLDPLTISTITDYSNLFIRIVASTQP